MDAGRAVCVVAPAGYGKTVLLSEYQRPRGGRKAWCTLDAADRDPSMLLAGLCSALGAVAPGGAPLPLPELLGWLDARQGPITLVLDDVHHLNGAPRAAGLINQLLAAALPAVRIFLCGRQLPTLPALPRLRLAGQVCDLGAADLAFTAEEAGRFLGLGPTPAWDPPAADRLHRLTGGWAAALRLLAGPGAPGLPPPAALRAYLEAELWGALRPDRRRFLAGAAVLPAWSAASCQRVLDDAGAAKHLSWVERAQFLVTPGPAGMLTPLPVWREYLLAELRRDPPRHRQLQRRAALWAAEQGDADQALEHALAAADSGLIEPLLRTAVAAELHSGGLQRIENWLEATPEPVLVAMPDLLLSVGEALRRAVRPRRAVRWLQESVAGYAARGGGGGGGLLRALCRLALAHGDLGEWHEAQAALAQVEAELPAAEGADRAEALLTLAEARAAGGEAGSAAAYFRTAAELFMRCDEPERAGAALAGLGARALVAMEDWEGALAALREARGLLSGAAACGTALAELHILVLLGRWEQVAALLPHVSPSSPAQQATLHWLQARVAMQSGDLFAAERFCSLGDLGQGDAEPTPGLRCSGLLTRAWLDHRSGNAGAALFGAYQARQLAEAAATPLLRAAARELLAACHPGREPLPDRLQIQLLGAFRVLRGGAEVGPEIFGRAQVRGVLQFLLLQPGFAAGREVILEAFWSETPADQSRAILRVTLHRLRKALELLGSGLETGPDLVRLPLEAIGWVDLVTFRSHLAAARRAAAVDPRTCMEHCRAGRALYRGDLLSDAFWSWAEPHRSDVRRDLAELLRLWHGAARQLGQPEEAGVVLEDMLDLDPGQEEAARELMLLLHRQGRRDEAIRRYRQLCRWLKEELGVGPSAETQELLRLVLEPPPPE